MKAVGLMVNVGAAVSVGIAVGVAGTDVSLGGPCGCAGQDRRGQNVRLERLDDALAGAGASGGAVRAAGPL